MFTHAVVTAGFDIQHTAACGIPVYWADLPPPCTASLVFRVGRCDERLSTAGITHLVEHLALFSLGRTQLDVDGFVDDVRTTFTARGTREEVLLFLQDVAAGLSDLPLERVDVERQLLLTEAATVSGSWEDQILNLRFGAVGHGVLGYPEFGLHRLTPGDVATWVRERFTRENAAAWVTTDPSGLELDLTPGMRRRVDLPPKIPGLELPAYEHDAVGGVAAQLVGPRSVSLAAGTAIAGNRLRDRLRMDAGVSYQPEASYRPLDAELANATIIADCRDLHATIVRDGMLDTLNDLSSRGPRREELSARAHDLERAQSDQVDLHRQLDVCVVDELLGSPVLHGEALLDEVRAATPTAVAHALEQAMREAIVIAPENTPAPPAPFVPHKPRLHDPLPVPSYRSRIASLPVARRMTADWRAGDAGVSVVEPGGEHLTIRWDECEAVLCGADRTVTIIARDGSWMEMNLSRIRDAPEFLSLLRSQVPDDLFVPIDDDAPGWLAVEQASGDLRHGWVAGAELRMLKEGLLPGERIERMAQGKVGVLKAGVLAVTDRRLIFVRAGVVESGNQVLEIPRGSITSIAARGGHRMVGGATITVSTRDGETRFTEIVPRERAVEIARLLSAQRRSPPT
jgi:hypothetical protein